MKDDFKEYKFNVKYVGDGNITYTKCFTFSLLKDTNIAFVTGVTKIVNYLGPDVHIKSVTIYD